mgnify:FL=1
MGKALALAKRQNVSQDKLAEVFGKEQPEAEAETQQLEGKISEGQTQPDFAEVEGHITAFFSYMDDQEYVQSYKFKKGTYHQYQIAIKK